jgi:hypothetical protein
MPRLPIDYSKTIIYKICCKDPTITDIYVGSTTNLVRRKSTHKCSYFNPNHKQYSYYVYDYIRKNGGWDNWEFIVVEQITCDNHQEALQKERYWLETLSATLNKQIPSRTNKEYRTSFKDKLREYEKEYYEKNKERHNQACKEYYEKNKEKLDHYQKDYREGNKATLEKYILEYREKNKEKLKEYRKQYYESNKTELKVKKKEYRQANKETIQNQMKEYCEKNRDKLKQIRNQKIACSCGGCYSIANQARHLKTKKHQDYLSLLS